MTSQEQKQALINEDHRLRYQALWKVDFSSFNSKRDIVQEKMVLNYFRDLIKVRKRFLKDIIKHNKIKYKPMKKNLLKI